MADVTGTPVGSAALAGLLDDAAFMSLEHQLHLVDVLGEHSWAVDLTAGEVTFTSTGDDGDRVRTCTRAHLLGSAAPGPQSWLWAWANPAGYSGDVVDLAGWLRGYGEAQGVPELTAGEVAFALLPVPHLEPADAVHVAVEAAKGASRVWASYCADVGGGTWAAFLVEHPDFVLPPPTGPRTVRVLTERLMGAPLTDPRRALTSYAAVRGLGLAWVTDRGSATVTGPAFTLEVRFDDAGRIAGVDGQLAG